jgi:hypothetical protein
MMTIKEKLNQIYLAARAAALNADQHAALQQYAKDIFEAIEEPDEVSDPEPKE